MESQNCPHCNARLYNPAPGRDGVIRCSSCGTPVSGEQAVAAPAGDPTTRSGESCPSPEPKPSSYVFVAAFGCVLLLVSIVLAFWMASWAWVDWVPGLRRGSFLLSQSVFAVVPFVVLALGTVALHVCLLPKRLDLAALRYAARHRELRGLKFPAERSGLDIFGPFLVIGSLFVIYALLAASTDEASTLGRELPGVLVGVALFFFGLTLADLHRFLWRMAFLAEQMTAGRNYAPQRPGFMHSLRHAIPFVILAAGFLGLKGCLEEVIGYGYGYGYGRSEGGLVVVSLACAACWSLYRFSWRVLVCLEAWGLVGPVAGKNFADRASRWWCVGALIGGLLVASCQQFLWGGLTRYSGLEWIALLYLAIVPVFMHRASAIACGLTSGRPAAGFLGLPRGWVFWSFGVILVGGVLGSVLSAVEGSGYFFRSGYLELAVLLLSSLLPLAAAVWVVGLLSPIHFLVVNMEIAASEKPKDASR